MDNVAEHGEGGREGGREGNGSLVQTNFTSAFTLQFHGYNTDHVNCGVVTVSTLLPD